MDMVSIGRQKLNNSFPLSQGDRNGGCHLSKPVLICKNLLFWLFSTSKWSKNSGTVDRKDLVSSTKWLTRPSCLNTCSLPLLSLEIHPPANSDIKPGFVRKMLVVFNLKIDPDRKDLVSPTKWLTRPSCLKKTAACRHFFL